MPRTRDNHAHARTRRPKRRRIPLPIESIRPIIRLSHCVTGPLNIDTRIIFDHELVLIQRGTGRLLLDRGFIPYGPRTLLALPPFLPHAFQSDGECRHIAVHFDLAPGVPRALQASGRRPYTVELSHGLEFPMHQELLHNDPIERGIVNCLDHWEIDDPLDRLQASAELLRVLVLILQRSRKSNAASEAMTQIRLRRAMHHIREHWRTIVDAGEVAAAAGVSISQMNRLLRRWAGEPAMTLVRNTRIDHARRMLAAGSLCVKEVARACGFANAFHFSRVFRKVDGLAPTQYQASVLRGKGSGASRPMA